MNQDFVRTPPQACRGPLTASAGKLGRMHRARLTPGSGNRHPLAWSRRHEAAGRTRTQAPVGGTAAEGTHRQAVLRAIEAQRSA